MRGSAAMASATSRENSTRSTANAWPAGTAEASFQDFLLYLRTTHSQVAQVYRFDKQDGFAGHGSAASRSFTAERLAAGATMLRDMIYTAWIDSARTKPDASGLLGIISLQTPAHDATGLQ